MKPMPLILFVGEAGVGKDTAAALVRELYGDENVFVTASAKPLKELARRIFKFNDDQLYGPSENRNQIDARFNPVEEGYKYLFQYEFISQLTGLHNIGLVNELVDWAIDSGYQANQAFDPACQVTAMLSTAAQENSGLSPRIVLQILGTEFGRMVDRSIWIKQSTKSGLDSIANGKALSIITDGRFLNEVFAVKQAGGIVIKLVGESSITSGHQSEVELNSVPATLIDYTIYNSKITADPLKQFKDKLEQILYPLISTQVVSSSKNA